MTTVPAEARLVHLSFLQFSHKGFTGGFRHEAINADRTAAPSTGNPFRSINYQGGKDSIGIG